MSHYDCKECGAGAHQEHRPDCRTVKEEAPSMEVLLKGHSSLADMIIGHIQVWDNCLRYAQAGTGSPADIAYYEHERSALADIRRAAVAQLKLEKA